MFSTTYKHLELLSVEIDSIEISQKKKNLMLTILSSFFSGTQTFQRQFYH